MNSFDSNDELSRLAATNPVANRTEPTDAVFEKAFGDAPAKGVSGFSLAWSRTWANQGNRWVASGLALTASVAVALSVFHAPAGSGGYLITTAGSSPSTASQSKMAAGAMSTTSALTSGLVSFAALAMPAFKVNYTAGPNLSDKAGTEAHIYQVVPDGDPKDIATALAGAFDIAGGVSKAKNGSDNYELYVPTADLAQQNQGEDLLSTRRSFYVDSSVWNTSFGYWNNATMRWFSCQQQNPSPKGCDAITKEQLPSLTEAKSQAAGILKALGLRYGTTLANTPDGGYLLDASYQDNTYATYTYTSIDGVATGATAPEQPQTWTEKSIIATASLVVAGQATPVQIQFSWMPGSSDISGVYGELAKAIDKGTFGTISPKDTIARLNDYGYAGQTSMDWNTVKWSDFSYQGMPQTMRDQLFKCTNSDSASECTYPLDNGIPQLEATATKSEETSLMIWDSSNGRWLVPGYNFYDSTGYLGSAFSVVDGIIKIDVPTDTPMMTK